MKHEKIILGAALLAAAVGIAAAAGLWITAGKETVSVSATTAETVETAAGVLTEDGDSFAEMETASAETAFPETEAAETEDASAEIETAFPESEKDAASDGSQDERAADEKPAVKGIYVTGPMAGTSNMDNLIALVDETELNALVIDIKNDEGYVVCEMDSPTVSEVGSVKRYVRDMPALIQKCKEKGIYLIARIVAFKDPLLAEAKPEWSLHLADGSIFRDRSGLAWVNPYEEAVWDYLVEVALESAEMGFDEIQFDYIRFSTDSGMKNVDFGPEAAQRSKEDVVADFTAYACEMLHEAGVAVSADVYGVVIDSEVDQQIVGQNYIRMSESLDFICPMVYPSHYGPYNYNIPVPDAQPYDTVKAAMQASKKVLAGMEPKEEAQESVSDNGILDGGISDSSISGNMVSDNAVTEDAAAGDRVTTLTDAQIAALEPMEGIRAEVRPWLQDFTASWVSGHIEYGPQQIRDQIQAVYDAGYEEWILWNASNRYTKDGLLPDEDLQNAAVSDNSAALQ